LDKNKKGEIIEMERGRIVKTYFGDRELNDKIAQIIGIKLSNYEYKALYEGQGTIFTAPPQFDVDHWSVEYLKKYAADKGVLLNGDTPKLIAKEFVEKMMRGVIKISRILAISDIHGCHDEFNALLREVNYNPEEDKLILLGDYVDRGFKSKEVVEQVKNLVEEWNIIALRGNHDQMFLDAMFKNEDELWLNNGGFQTVESYVGSDWFENGFNPNEYFKAKEFIHNHYSHHLKFLKTLKVYHETDNHIFVHAGLHPLYSDDWKNQPTENFLWIRNVFLNNKTNLDKTVIHGHTPNLYLHETEDIYFGDGKIGIDGGCCFGYQLNALEINNDKDYQTHFAIKGSK
jgi:serine/threonine protein phosphatase 1